MKTGTLIFGLFLLIVKAHAQETPVTGIEQQLENITQTNEDNETEDDAYLQQLDQYIKHPLNLNYATIADLEGLPVLNPLQATQLIAYRDLMGPLINIYELQAVPLWNIGLIQKIRPYITVSVNADQPASFLSRLEKGDRSVLVRVTQVLERSKGYEQHDSSSINFYPGSPQKILLRYKYVYRNLVQYGILAEKDAGEQFFKGKQKLGFDFYSFHFFARNIGIIKAIALGDFVVNMGQGLIQWQSLAFKKSAAVMSVKREADVLKPYNSAGEINFHRGLGITLQKRNWQASFFVSYKKIDANLVTDSLVNGENHVSSLQTSGYHRTGSETADKGIQRQLAFGANLSYQFRRLHLGINGIWYKFKLPLTRADDPYNQYSLRGRSFENFSLDYGYTYKNLHLFGEIAFTGQLNKGLISGLLISATPAIDICVLYRHISRSYQSLYSNAFTASVNPGNENGLYAGITVRPNSYLQIDAYADVYQFPWLKYRVDKPSNGSDLLIQATYKPNKQLEIYSRFQCEKKEINVNPDGINFTPVIAQPRQNWRTQISYRLNANVTLKSRVEMNWFDEQGKEPEQGFLTFLDILYKPVLKPFSGNLRLQYFETSGYNSRLYAFENDVQYSYSIPSFYDKGYRYYINISYDVNKKLTGWIRWSQTLYRDKNLIGTGLDEIKGNVKSEAKVQIIYKF